MTFARPCLPPPGLYGGVVGLYSTVTRIDDGTGNPAPGLDAVNLNAEIAGAFFLYVPNVKVFDGSVAVYGLVNGGQECGQAVSVIPRRCVTGFGDPYVEADWSRVFGQVKPHRRLLGHFRSSKAWSLISVWAP